MIIWAAEVLFEACRQFKISAETAVGGSHDKGRWDKGITVRIGNALANPNPFAGLLGDPEMMKWKGPSAPWNYSRAWRTKVSRRRRSSIMILKVINVTTLVL